MSKLISDAVNWDNREQDIKDIIDDFNKDFNKFLKDRSLDDNAGISKRYYQEIQKFRKATEFEIKSQSVTF